MSAPLEKPINIISLSHPIVRFGWTPQGTAGGPVTPPVIHNLPFLATMGQLMGR